MNRGLRIFLIQVIVLAAALGVISIIWLPWYWGAMAVCGTALVTWLVVRLLCMQLQQKQGLEPRNPTDSGEGRRA